MILIGNRDDVVITRSGHSIGFKKGQETYVHNDTHIIKQCVERGHLIKETPSEEGTVEEGTVEEGTVEEGTAEEGTAAEEGTVEAVTVEKVITARKTQTVVSTKPPPRVRAHRKVGYIVTA